MEGICELYEIFVDMMDNSCEKEYIFVWFFFWYLFEDMEFYCVEFFCMCMSFDMDDDDGCDNV